MLNFLLPVKDFFSPEIKGFYWQSYICRNIENFQAKMGCSVGLKGCLGPVIHRGEGKCQNRELKSNVHLIILLLFFQ